MAPAKFIFMCVVAAVLVSAACAQADQAQEGGVRAFGRKIVDQTSSILSHIPFAGKYFKHSDDKSAQTPPASKAEEQVAPTEQKEDKPAAAQEEPAATQEEPAVAQEEPTAAPEEQAQTEAPKSEEPAKEEEKSQ